MTWQLCMQFSGVLASFWLRCVGQGKVIVVNELTIVKRLPARKLMVTVFCDRKAVLIVGFRQQDTTVKTAVTCEVLRRFYSAIQNKKKSVEC
jgi:hypothetical protein